MFESLDDYCRFASGLVGEGLQYCAVVNTTVVMLKNPSDHVALGILTVLFGCGYLLKRYDMVGHYEVGKNEG